MSDSFPTREEAERRYHHGTYARYKLAGCRCVPCSFASSEYTRRRTEARPPWRTGYAPEARRWYVRNSIAGEIALRTYDQQEAIAKRDELNAPLREDPSDKIDAWHTRKHLLWLRSQGVGRRTVSEATGVAQSNLRDIARGEHRRILRGTAEKIMSVGLSDARGTALLDGARTWELLDCLLSAGWPKARIARELGSTARIPALQIKRARVQAHNARKVEELHRRSWWEDPRVREVCPHEHARIRMEKTQHARDYGTTVRALEGRR